MDRVIEDHALGHPGAAVTPLEYGSFHCRYCNAAREVVARLRDRFGDRMRYVFRHRPIGGDDLAARAAEIAELASATRTAPPARACASRRTLDPPHAARNGGAGDGAGELSSWCGVRGAVAGAPVLRPWLPGFLDALARLGQRRAAHGVLPGGGPRDQARIHRGPAVRATRGRPVLQAEMHQREDLLVRHGPSEPALRELDAIHGRMESPADQLLRTVEPWSSYFVLPIFALANAVAVKLRLALKPDAYSWRQLLGAGALAGIGFTMSLYMAAKAFPDAGDFAAAKLAVFAASIAAGLIGTAILWSSDLRKPAPGRAAVQR